ncbi:hypothetical protein J6590_031533 [Homalodisca vitripennis]|nr:hypothetical protein J6590_031533 [Homalodisca vitripennis]
MPSCVFISTTSFVVTYPIRAVLRKAKAVQYPSISYCVTLEQLCLQIGFESNLLLVVDFNLVSARNPTNSNVSNVYGSQLDLAFTDLSSIVTCSLDPIVCEDTHHSALDVDLTLPAQNSSSQLRFLLLELELLARLATACYNSYIPHVDRTISTNSKIIWSHVNDLRRTDVTRSRLVLGDVEASTPHGIGNLFARHFSSLYSELKIPFKDNILSLSLIQWNSEEVKREIHALNIHKGCSPKCIPPQLTTHPNQPTIPPVDGFVGL